jgi:hypothetical protein
MISFVVISKSFYEERITSSPPKDRKPFPRNTIKNRKNIRSIESESNAPEMPSG